MRACDQKNACPSNLKFKLMVAILTLLLGGVSTSVADEPFTNSARNNTSSGGRFSDAARFAEYERQLNAILKTRRDEERIFVAQIVSQVRDGKIPSKLVSTSFDWVHKKRPGTKYPFIYFEKIIRLQARQLEIQKEIPPFDFSIYRRSVGQLSPSSRTTAGQATPVRRSSFLTPGSLRR